VFLHRPAADKDAFAHPVSNILRFHFCKNSGIIAIVNQSNIELRRAKSLDRLRMILPE
jgi:hypothetical protein